MTDRTYQLALQIDAGLSQATRDLETVDGALEAIGASGKRAATGLNATAGAADKAAAATSRVQAATTAEAAALEKSNARRERLAALINSARGQRLLEAEAIRKGTTEIGKQTISVGQYNAAMRMLPAQMTDITVGLATGQSPFMVMLQQGGQLKDSFGGVGAAARAVIGAISPMAVVAGGAAAGLVMLGKGAYEGSQELHGIENALIMTGNSAGKTAGQLIDAAQAMDRLEGVTQGSATQALIAVANTGKIAGDNIQLVATSAEQMRVATGQAIDDTISEFLKLADDPVKAILELDGKYHFLTQSQLENIRTLKEQGHEQDAVTEAYRLYAGMISDRTPKVLENLGWIEKAWRSIKQVASETYDGAMDLGRAPGTDAQIKRLKEEIAYMRDASAGGLIDLKPGQLEAKQAQLKKLQASTVQVQWAGIYAPVDQKADAARQAAEKKWSALVESNLSKQEKLEKEINDIKAQGLAAGKSEAEIQAQIAQARARYKESLPKAPKGQKTETQKDQEAAARELENLTKQVALTGQLEDGQKKASEAARIRFEIDQGAYKLADAGTKQQLLQQAQLLDAANARNETDRKMLEVRQQIAALSGGNEDGEILKARRELELFQADLQKNGELDKAAEVGQLLGFKQAAADLANLRQKYDQVMGGISLDIQRIQVERQAGLITEADAQQRVVDVYQRQLGALRDMVPLYRAVAMRMKDGSDAQKEALALTGQIENKLKEMSATTNLLQQTVRSTFQDSFNSALNSLIKGTASLGDAVQNFFVSMVQGMAEFVAQDWSQKATNWVMSKAGGLLGGDTATASSTGDTAGATAIASAGSTAASAITVAGNTVAAAISAAANGNAFSSAFGSGGMGESDASVGIDIGVEQAAGALGESGNTVMSGAQALTNSATQLASAVGGLSPGASAIINAAIQLFTAAQAMQVSSMAGAAGGFAAGGWTGPGSKYQATGVVHAEEFVHRREVVRQPGALSFLYDFNRRGMAALRDWRTGYADGGLVAAPMMQPAPRASLTNSAAMGGPVNNRMRVYMYQDLDQLRAAILNHPAAEKKIVATAAENGQAIRADW